MKRSSILKPGISFLIFGILCLSCNNGTETETVDTDTTQNSSTSPTSADGNSQEAQATLSGTKADTSVTGTVNFMPAADGKIKMTLNIQIPSKANQSVAIHIHEHGDCGNSGDHAGGHWNPTNTNHGEWDKNSFHSGDIGNISLDGEGRATKEITSDRWSLGGDAQKDILNKTIVVHSGVDDYTSQPSGNSGSRIGCGVIQRK